MSAFTARKPKSRADAKCCAPPASINTGVGDERWPLRDDMLDARVWRRARKRVTKLMSTCALVCWPPVVGLGSYSS